MARTPAQHGNISIEAYTVGYIVYEMETLGGIEQPGNILAAFSCKDDLCMWLRDYLTDADY